MRCFDGARARACSLGRGRVDVGQARLLALILGVLHAHARAHARAHAHARSHARTQAHAHTHANAHIHTHAHTHTRGGIREWVTELSLMWPAAGSPHAPNTHTTHAQAPTNSNAHAQRRTHANTHARTHLGGAGLRACVAGFACVRGMTPK